MNFNKASDRRDHHLVTMSVKLASEYDVLDAIDRLWHMRVIGRVTLEQYHDIGKWIEEQRMKLAQWRGKHPGRRVPIDEVIRPENLTAEQRRRLKQQRRNPGSRVKDGDLST